MIRRLAYGAGAGAWFVLAFWIVYRLTFPSAAVAERLSWEAQERADMGLSAASTHPWWLGVGATGVSLKSSDGTALVDFDSARVRFGLLGLLTRTPTVMGHAVMGDGDIRFSVGTGSSERGLLVQAVELSAPAFPMAALPPVAGMKLQGRGAFALDVALEGTDGFADGDGHLRWSGSELILEGIPSLGQVEGVFPLVVEDLDLDLEFIDGKGKFESGRISSSLGDVDLSGTITLARRIERAKCEIDIELRPSEDLPSLALTLLAAGKQSEGVYKFRMRGLCSRATPTPVRARRARTPNNRRPAAGPASNPDKAEPATEAAEGGARPTTPTADLRRAPAVGGLGRRGAAAALPPREVPDVEDDEELEEIDELEELDELEVEEDPALEGVEEF